MKVSPGCSPLPYPSLKVYGSHSHLGDLREVLGHLWNSLDQPLYCHSPSLPPARGQDWEEPFGDPIWESKAPPWGYGTWNMWLLARQAAEEAPVETESVQVPSLESWKL